MEIGNRDRFPNHTRKAIQRIFTFGNLTEDELLNLEALQLDDLIVTPYEYKEQFEDDGSMRIDARARLDADQVKLFRSLPAYFPVIRQGINSTPRQMRFGKLLWSDHGDYVKHEIILLDRRERDDGKIAAIFEPEMSHIKAGIAKTSCLMKALFEALEAKGVLDIDTISEIKKQAEDGMEDRLRQFTQVDDLDRWA